MHIRWKRHCLVSSFPVSHGWILNLKSAYRQTTCHYKGVNGKNTRHHEFGTTVNVFEIILLASTPRKSLDRKDKQAPNIEFSKKQQTVPSSIYTVVPQAAMRAPTSHMIKDTPTLPEDRRMLLGVAYILIQRRWSVRVHLPIFIDSGQLTRFLSPNWK